MRDLPRTREVIEGLSTLDAFVNQARKQLAPGCLATTDEVLAALLKGLVADRRRLLDELVEERTRRPRITL